ncbi:hypothetical protein CBW46_014255 [Paenibacillus xerothermodurans]|uniref:Uncharacterized protein n=1 Tax=Paenibacillus xerothermodurans TaxID=1977292 RepID=A0A2W1N7C1_PAEXE|nr:hypothetical protein CBW46_014255 [Paenibacillus xerothermodurans]
MDTELVQLTRKWTCGDIDKEMFNACSVAVKTGQALEERAAGLQTDIAHEHDTDSSVSTCKAELFNSPR